VEVFNQGVSQDCPLSPALSGMYRDGASSEWQMQLKSHCSIRTVILDTLLFADDQVTFAESEDELQMATLQLSDIMATYNLEISCDKMKNLGFSGK
jgi:hypothetical protein